LVKGLVLAAVVLVLAAGGAVFAWPYLSDVMTKVPDQLAKGDGPGNADGDTRKTSPAGPRDSKKTDLPIRHDSSKSPTEHPTPTTRREGPSKPPDDLPKLAGPLPRRALAVSINDYLFANPINFGMPLPGSNNVRTLLERFSQPASLHIPGTQVGLLSDGAPERMAQAPTAEVIRATVARFLDTSRAQDRILLLLIGHVVEIENEPMLIAIDGAPDSKDEAIPLKWFYEQLSACKARQKVLILDTCRLDPSKGMERPGSGPMGAKLDAMLKEPPPGVQVWTACVAEQYSYEFEGGDIGNGLFLDALAEEVANVSRGKIQKPDDPLPLERLVEGVNARMKGVLGPLGKVQTSRLAGSEAEGGAEPDPKEPMPPKPQPVIAVGRPGEKADLTAVRSILKDISFPPLKVAKDTKPLTAESLPPIPADALKDYADEGEATPLRAEVQKARALLNSIASNQLNDNYVAEAEKPLKDKVRADQKKVAKIIGDLMEASEALKAVAGDRKKESKRWQATYDYVSARMDAQLAYLNEYETVLGQILKGLAAPDPKLYRGWRLASQYDPQTGDRDAKKYAGESRKKLDKIIQAYPNTPWAIMARRDRASGLGLEWQPMK
jgi:hypothetical protein